MAPVFSLEHLTALDLSYNELGEVPEAVDRATSLVVLNLSGNRIREASSFLKACTALRVLDLGHNAISNTRAIGRLTWLEGLVLSGNPLATHASLAGLHQLRRLDLASATATPIATLPDDLFASMSRLEELDLSGLGLDKLPSSLLGCARIARLNLADNALDAAALGGLAALERLESLNLSRNRLELLPEAVCALVRLRRLWASGNAIALLPDGVGELGSLQLLVLRCNRIAALPEAALLRCRHLERVDVSANAMVAVPQSLFRLPALISLLALDNPLAPSAPAEARSAMAAAPPYAARFPARPEGDGLDQDASAVPALDEDAASEDALPPPPAAAEPQFVEGFGFVVGDKISALLASRPDPDSEPAAAAAGPGAEQHVSSALRVAPGARRARNIRALLPQRTLDYARVFGGGDDILEAGTTVWRVANFEPRLLGAGESNGIFADTGAYLVLHVPSEYDEPCESEHEEDPGAPRVSSRAPCTCGRREPAVYFWLGAKAGLDRIATAAMLSVHLAARAQVMVSPRREEQGAESKAFVAIFGGVDYATAPGPSSDFRAPPPPAVPAARLFRLSGRPLQASAAPVAPRSLHAAGAALVDTGVTAFLWRGRSCTVVCYQQARLLAGRATAGRHLVEVAQGAEPAPFWAALGVGAAAYGDEAPPAHPTPRLYRLQLGEHALELPQVAGAAADGGLLQAAVLRSDSIFILDAIAEQYVWVGRQASRSSALGRLAIDAAERLSAELTRVLQRPAHFAAAQFPEFVDEGHEPEAFRAKFAAWAPLSPCPVPSWLDPRAPRRQLVVEADVAPLFSAFAPRSARMNAALARSEYDWDETIESCQTLFTFCGGAFERVRGGTLQPALQADQCHVVFCKERHSSETGTSRITLSLWEGREAPKTAWPVFQLWLVPRLREELGALQYGVDVVVAREQQQRETRRFTALFRRRMLLVRAPPADMSAPRLFQVIDGATRGHDLGSAAPVRPMAFGSPAPQRRGAVDSPSPAGDGRGPAGLTRTVEVPADANRLDGRHCYLLMVPKTKVLILWKGTLASASELHAARLVAGVRPRRMSQKEKDELAADDHLFTPGETPWGPDYELKQLLAYGTGDPAVGRLLSEFATAMGARLADVSSGLLPVAPSRRKRGQPPPPPRLFPCALVDGRLVVTESNRYPCQDDLDEAGAALLAAHGRLYTWHGPLASTALVALADAAAQEYCTRCDAVRASPAWCNLGSEPPEFAGCFPGWGRSLVHSCTLARPVAMLASAQLDATMPPKPALRSRVPLCGFALPGEEVAQHPPRRFRHLGQVAARGWAAPKSCEQCKTLCTSFEEGAMVVHTPHETTIRYGGPFGPRPVTICAECGPERATAVASLASPRHGATSALAADEALIGALDLRAASRCSSRCASALSPPRTPLARDTFASPTPFVPVTRADLDMGNSAGGRRRSRRSTDL